MLVIDCLRTYDNTLTMIKLKSSDKKKGPGFPGPLNRHMAFLLNLNIHLR